MRYTFMKSNLPPAIRSAVVSPPAQAVTVAVSSKRLSKCRYSTPYALSVPEQAMNPSEHPAKMTHATPPSSGLAVCSRGVCIINYTESCCESSGCRHRLPIIFSFHMVITIMTIGLLNLRLYFFVVLAPPSSTWYTGMRACMPGKTGIYMYQSVSRGFIDFITYLVF